MTDLQMPQYRATITITQHVGDKSTLVTRGATDGYTLRELIDPAMMDRLRSRAMKTLEVARQAAQRRHKEAAETTATQALGSAELRKLADAMDTGSLRLGEVLAYRDPQDPHTLIIKSYHRKATDDQT